MKPEFCIFALIITAAAEKGGKKAGQYGKERGWQFFKVNLIRKFKLWHLFFQNLILVAGNIFFYSCEYFSKCNAAISYRKTGFPYPHFVDISTLAFSGEKDIFVNRFNNQLISGD